MILNVVSYTRNSIVEKLALAALNKAKIELNIEKGKPEQDKADEEEWSESNG